MLVIGLIYLVRNSPVVFLGVLSFLIPASLYAQNWKLEYNVLHNGDVKGTVQLYQHTEGNTLQIKIESLVQTRFLFKITVKTIEEAVFREGLLICSRYYQKINNDVEHNLQINWMDGAYKFSGKDENPQTLKTPIQYTTLSLYHQEPANIREVYSNNFQKNIPVIKVAPGKYKLTLPNGNSNYYIYQQGVLVRVEVNQPFYTMQFILKP